MDQFERLAAEMLTLQPQVWFNSQLMARPYSLAIWVGRMYGYVYAEQDTPEILSTRSGEAVVGHMMTFTRNDEPGARRRAEWMRNPAADPALKAPVVWHLDGGPGFHPPGWHPAARIVITAEVEASLRYEDEQFARKLGLGWRAGINRRNPVPLPPTLLPPPPPDTVAYPDPDLGPGPGPGRP